MLILFAVITALTALACWMTERVDRPRRRAERLSRVAQAQPAE